MSISSFNSFPTSLFLNSLNGNLNLAPSKFKSEASTVKILGIQPLHNSVYKYPQTHLLSTPHQTDGFVSLSVDTSIIGDICVEGKNVNSYDCKQLHAFLVKLGAIKGNYLIGNKLVVVYLRDLECFSDARKLFDEMPKRTVSSYAALIGSLCKLEKWVDVLFMLQMMLSDGMLPDRYLIPTILKACSAMQRGNVGKMVHGFVIKWGFNEDVFVANALIDMYANCGSLSCAKSVFDTMCRRDVVSWTILVASYMTYGFIDEAIETFERIELDGLRADLISWNALIFGFAQNGEIELALLSLEEMQGKGMKPNVNTWNAIISGCVENDYYEDALDAFVRMLWTQLMPNVVTFVSTLPACAGLKNLKFGKVIHGHSIKLGLSEDTNLEGSLINMYWKCERIYHAETIFSRIKHKNLTIMNEMIAAYVNEGKLGSALMLFNSMKGIGLKADQITYNTLLGAYASEGEIDKVYELLSVMLEMGLQPNLVTFNILISRFRKSGLFYEALSLFQDMQSQCSSSSCLSRSIPNPIRPNPITVNAALSACAGLRLQRHGKELHGHIVRNLLESNIFLASSLVHMYAKCCYDMDLALKVFWRTKNSNTIMWNSLLMGYLSRRQVNEAFSLFKRMIQEGHEPNMVTFLILLPACGEAGGLRLGRELHGCLMKCDFDKSHEFLASALIDMYAKCGSVWSAKRVFDYATSKDVAVWNCMISSFAAHGMSNNSILLFTQMEKSRVIPDGKTFVALLSACARDGLVQLGWKYFNLMENTYGISPSLEHYSCMVGLLGAVGLLDEALKFIEKMPLSPDACVWSTLLRYCRTHLDLEIEKRASKALLELETGNGSYYITHPTCKEPD